MESFGLANFLQSLLKITAPTEQPSPPSEPVESAAEPAPQSAQEEPIEPPSVSTDAVLQFMHAHDERARRLKR